MFYKRTYQSFYIIIAKLRSNINVDVFGLEYFKSFLSQNMIFQRVSLKSIRVQVTIPISNQGVSMRMMLYRFHQISILLPSQQLYIQSITEDLSDTFSTYNVRKKFLYRLFAILLPVFFECNLIITSSCAIQYLSLPITYYCERLVPVTYLLTDLSSHISTPTSSHIIEVESSFSPRFR